MDKLTHFPVDIAIGRTKQGLLKTTFPGGNCVSTPAGAVRKMSHMYLKV